MLLKLTEAGAELQKEMGREHVRDISGLLGPALTAAEQRELRRLTEKLRHYRRRAALSGAAPARRRGVARTRAAPELGRVLQRAGCRSRRR